MINEGTILLQKTSDEILMDLKGNTQEVNPHTEHWLVEDIKATTIKLYNLDTQRTWTIKKELLDGMLKGNKRFGIEPMFQISNEQA